MRVQAELYRAKVFARAAAGKDFAGVIVEAMTSSSKIVAYVDVDGTLVR